MSNAILEASDIADIAVAGLAHYDRYKMTDLASDDEEHIFLPQITQKERMVVSNGSSFTWDILKSDAGDARRIGLHDKDEYAITDVLAQGDVPWRHYNKGYAADIREKGMNSGPAKIVDIMQARRAAAWQSFSNLLESDGWSKPATSSIKDQMFGLKTWIVKKVTGDSLATGNGEFGGGNPSGFTSGVAGVDSTSITRWANWTHCYANVTKSDLIAKMRLAFHRTNFKSPIKDKRRDTQRGPDRYVIYMPYLILRDLETIAEQQNQNGGRDVAFMDGRTVFRRVPLVPVSKLDDDSDDPVYFVNWAVMFFAILEGFGLREEKVHPIEGMRFDVGANIDLSGNLVCQNRRRLAVLAKTANND